VDCISMVEATPGRAGWDAWSGAQADEARERYAFHRIRTERQAQENAERLALEAQAKLDDLPAASAITDPLALDRKRAVIEAALARARARRS
jgi:electron transport complex protein RnfB